MLKENDEEIMTPRSGLRKELKVHGIQCVCSTSDSVSRNLLIPKHNHLLLSRLSNTETRWRPYMARGARFVQNGDLVARVY